MNEVFQEMIGRTMETVEECSYDRDELWFVEAGTGITHKFFHQQDCCESVWIEDICGELADPVGSPILQAECVGTEYDNENEDQNWTFYKFTTIKGSVTVRWYGRSNGFYSTIVSYSCD